MRSAVAIALASFAVTCSAVPIAIPNFPKLPDFGCALNAILQGTPCSQPATPASAPTGVTPTTPNTAPSPPSSGSSGPVDGHIFVCDTWNFQGNCQSIGFADNTCQNFPSTFQDTISSIKPDDGWNCQAFGNNDCNDNQGTLTVSAPGISQMTTMNDALSSFKCLRQ